VTRSARSDLLELAEELEREDRRLAAELEVVDGLAHRLHAVREGVGRIEAQLAQIGREEEHLERALAEIDALLAGARAAAAEQDDSPDGHDGLPAALEERRRHTVERREQVAAERQDALDGVRALADEARAVEAALQRTPRLAGSVRHPPGDDLASIALWTEPAHAVLLVARGALEEERQLTVREAAEAASAALGEPVGPGSVGGLRRRLERELS
jgi:DNA repair exonuclease SbcCD ATPase subunit